MDRVDIDELVTRLQERVARRRAAGDYPPGLEEQLEAEFRVVMAAAHRREITTEVLQARTHAVAAATVAVSDVADVSSRVPGGAALHQVVAKAVQRHTGALAAAIRSIGDETTKALLEIGRLFEAQRSADERQLDEVISALIDRLVIIDHVADAVLDLERRVDALEAKA